MEWQDQGYLISKKSYNENSIVADFFTKSNGKQSGIIYGGNSKNKKKYLQLGNKFFIFYKSKNLTKIGYFNTELIDHISVDLFDENKKLFFFLSAISLINLLLPYNLLSNKLYSSLEELILSLKTKKWFKDYTFWELNLIKELGFEISFDEKKVFFNQKTNIYEISLNDKKYIIPEFYLDKEMYIISKKDALTALTFNKNIIIDHFILPNRLTLPLNRKLLETLF